MKNLSLLAVAAISVALTTACDKSEQPDPASKAGYDYSKAESWMIHKLDL